MKNPLKLHFEDAEEKKKFHLECSAIDCRRVYLYVSIIAIFELFLLVFDRITQNEIYSKVQWAYCILNSVMAAASIFMVGLTFWAKKNLEQRNRIFRAALAVYAFIILFCAVCDAITGTISSGRENLTMFFICIMLVSCVFYVDSKLVFLYSIIFFLGFELFTHLTAFSSHHTYAPYPVFIIFITDTVSFVRARQLKDLIQKTRVIRKLQEQAEYENQQKSQFLANMSHEIRTPMNAIVGMSELAMDFNLNDSEKNTIRQIRTSGINLVGIINDILDFSKIESGKMEIVPVEYDLVKMMNDICNVCLVRITNKPVELILEIEEDLPAFYYGDDMRIRQILINLAGNSSKFTEKGFIKIRTENLRKFEDKDGLRISVIDSGIGIKKEDLSKLFGAFQQVDMKMNRTKGGTGLGLSISRNLAKLMGGSLNVTSEYGKGSCFYIDLPQKITDETKCSEKYKSLFEKAERSTENPKLAVIPVVGLLNSPEFAGLFVEKSETVMFKAPEAQILVVDDNDVNLQVAKGLLSKFEITPDLAESGQAALDMMKQKDYHIVFMDHQMPGMDGIEALEIIRREEAEGKRHRIVVALSANAINGAREMFLSKGFDDFLAKPVQGKDFASCIAEWLPVNLLEKIGTETESGVEIPAGFPAWNKERLSLVEAVSNSGGLENYLKAVKTFYLSIEKNANLIGKCLITDDIKNYTIHVHALKSAARIIGAMEVSKKAEYLEGAGKDFQKAEAAGNSAEAKRLNQEIHERTSSLISLYTSYLKDLRAIVEFAESRKEKNASFDPKALEQALDAILSACTKFDLPVIEEQFETVKNMQTSGEIQKLIESMEKAITDIEFEDIERICREAKKKLNS